MSVSVSVREEESGCENKALWFVQRSRRTALCISSGVACYALEKPGLN